MIAKIEQLPAERKERTQENSRKSSKPLPKKFQKLVVETLLGKDNDKSHDSEPEENFELPQFVGSTLNLTRKHLKEFPKELLQRAEFVQYLYLEGNKLNELPKSFFQWLSNLKWLDLRNNNLVELPTVGLKNHNFLEFLLLQGNRIEYLPTELGILPTLKGLQITGNPIINVPYDVIASGFQGIVNHLRKLNLQENILIPNSDTVVVRPSIDKESTEYSPGESQRQKGEAVEKEGDETSNLRRWKDMIGETYVLLDGAKTERQLKMSRKFAPKLKHRFMSSHCRSSIKTHSRLGYKTKMITPEMLQEKAQKEIQTAKRRETLEKQARKIQRMKDKETLRTWRRQTLINAEQIRLLDNYQQYPSRNFATDSPFDVDPDFLNMLNRADLYRSLKEIEAMHKKRRMRGPKTKFTLSELEKQMKEIKKKLESLDISEGNVSPRAKQHSLSDKINQMERIHQTLKNLQYKNISASLVP